MDLNKLLNLISEGKKGFEIHKHSFKKIADDFLLKFNDREIKSLSNLRKSHLFLPVISSKVRRILCSFQEAYFSNEEIAKINLLNHYGDKTLTDKLQEAFNYYTKNKINLFMPLSKSMLDAILFGTTIIKCFWSDSIKLETINIFDVYFDPSANSFSDIKYIIHIVYMSRMDILKFKNKGVFEDIDIIEDDFLYKKEKLFEVYYFDKTWHLATIFENKIIRKISLNDGLPFLVGTLIPQTISCEDEKCVRVYGDSPTAILCSLQREINIRRNQQIDAISLALNPRVLIEEGSLIDPNAFIKGAGEVISCADVNGVKFAPTPSMQEGIFDVNRLDVEAQEAIGVTNYNSGVSTNNLNQTATGISVLSSEANTRIQSLIRSYNETLMQPLMSRIAQLIYKYDPLFMGNFANRTPLEIIAKINTGIGATNPQTQIMNLQKAFEMMMSIQNIYGATKILKEMLPLLGIKNNDEYFQEVTNGI